MTEDAKKNIRIMKSQELYQLPKTDLIKEIIRLRKKSNDLLDKMNIQLAAGNEQLKTNILESTEKLQEKKVNIDLAFRFIYRLSKELQYPEKWIPYKNVTPNSKEYYRMKKPEFLKIADEMEVDKKTIQLLLDLGVIKPSQQGPVSTVTANGRYVPVYIIKKSALHALGGADERK